MTWPIVCFLLLGAAFGFLSFRHRHHFSEGVTAPGDGRDGGPGATWAARLGWVTMCTLLWPLMLFTGLAGAWLRARAVPSSQPTRAQGTPEA